MKEVIVYNRTSTEEQNPENQVSDCLGVIKKLGLGDYSIVQEQTSGWKDHTKRIKFDEIREAIRKGEIKVLVVWDLDRIYRNRKMLVGFFETCKIYGCKVYSYRQEFLNEINKMPTPWNEIMTRQMLEILGWMAEDESNKKSDRIKSAMIKTKGTLAKSKYGNKWGRKALPDKTKKLIITLWKDGKSFRQIREHAYYYDANNHKKVVSIGSVHKIIEEYKCKNLANPPLQKRVDL